MLGGVAYLGVGVPASTAAHGAGLCRLWALLVDPLVIWRFRNGSTLTFGQPTRWNYQSSDMNWVYVDPEDFMKVVYIAGPFRGPNSWEIEQNIRRAEALALEVWRAGFAAICPHANTRFYQGAAPDEVWLQGDLAILRRCDAVLLTEDWQRSAGAKAEKAHAEMLRIPVFRSVLDLVEAHQ